MYNILEISYHAINIKIIIYSLRSSLPGCYTVKYDRNDKQNLNNGWIIYKCKYLCIDQHTMCIQIHSRN